MKRPLPSLRRQLALAAARRAMEPDGLWRHPCRGYEIPSSALALYFYRRRLPRWRLVLAPWVRRLLGRV